MLLLSNVKAKEHTLLFVYGTLKRGCRNHSVLRNQSFVGEASTVPGFRLLNLGEYPGMIADHTSLLSVTGEIWSVERAALERLDAFEGVGEGLYRRAAIRLQEPFAHELIQTYLYARAIAGLPEIASGVWRE